MTANDEAARNGRAAQIEVGPLNAAELNELCEHIDPRDLTTHSDALGDLRLGDPGATIAVITVSTAAITGLSAFLLKPRRRVRARYNVTARFPDGTTIDRTIEYESSEASAPSPDVLRALTGLTGVTIPLPDDADGS